MDATPFNFGQAMRQGGGLPGAGRASFGQAATSALSMRWSALHDAAAAVAALARVAPEIMPVEVRQFPMLMRDLGGWRRERAEQGVDDLTAIMEPGLSALLSVHARGADASRPARALLDEFHRARDALLGLLPPANAGGPRRSA